MLNIRGKRLSLTVLIGSAILLVQLGAIAFVHISGSDERYLAWAPNDYAVDYSISTSVHGRALTPEQVADRYGLPAHGLWEYPPQQLIDILSRYESTDASGRDVVTLRYSLDGHPTQTWRKS